MALGWKQSSSDADWREVWEHISSSPDRERARWLVGTAAGALQDVLKGPTVYAWSGGKDSLALQAVAQAAGVADCFLVTTPLEWPSFNQYVAEHAPHDLTVVKRSGVNHAWLRENPHMIFPATSDRASQWFKIVQHTGQRSYCKANGVEHLLLGRRRADGNYLGLDLGGGVYGYKDRDGFQRVCPIAEGSHEDVLTVIAAYGYALPPIYDHPDGFRHRTVPWAAHRYATPGEGWDTTYKIDPTVVQRAAEHRVPGAAEYLERRQ